MKNAEESKGRSEEPEPQADAGQATSQSRRSFLQATALAAGGAALAPLSKAEAQSGDANAQDVAALSGGHHDDVANASIAELQSLMSSRRLSSQELLDIYLRRIQLIDKGLDLRSIIQLNPDARRIARQLDDERRRSGPRGPLHGIPILLKDNIDTGDRQQTTAGSLALAGAPALQDATVTARLRAAGAVIIGKANLSEWANFRGFQSSSGFSGVGRQCRNPHILDRNPCGSSSGSGAATAAALTAAALATETDGSIVCPAGQCGVAGIKPTVGLTSRAGVVPISHTQDTVGVHGRSLADSAAVLGALTGPDARDPQTAASAGHFFRDYRPFINPDGLRGARIGVARQLTGATPEMDAVFEDAVQVMRDAGAVVIDPIEFPSFDEFNADQSEIIVLIFEFKRDLNAYLATRSGVPVSTLADVIQFNLDHAEEELKFFGQELMELAEAEIFSQADYDQALVRGPQLAGPQGIDAALAANNLHAIVAPTNTPAWPTDLINGDAFLFGSSGFAAVAGYPLVTVTGGFAFDLPVGITFMASAWSEPTLIRLASGFEAAAGVRRRPRFLRTFNPDGTSGGHGRSKAMDALAARSASSVMQRHAAKLDQFLVPRLRRPTFL
ncbi:MAG TPA: amidase [Steroidobacteraceae bacterium]|jgi:amidase|nr:amidase [Steroidobacteraceae bacterium]